MVILKRGGKTNKFIDKIEMLKQGNLGITVRKLVIHEIDIYILYISQLTDRDMLSEKVIKPILCCHNRDFLNICKVAGSVIYADDLVIDDDENRIIDYILSGRSIMIISGEESYIAINTVKIEKRTTSIPEIEYTIRGSRDSFVENIDSNISLIRYRLKDPGLRIDKFLIGRRSKTNVAVLYIDDITNSKLVDEVENRIKSIKIDVVLESGSIAKYLEDNKLSMFPQSGIVERPDIAVSAITQGKVIILVEGSNFALAVPMTFVQFWDSPDDHYEKPYLSIFTKFIRMICVMITLELASLYVAIVSYHSDIMPASYIVIIASARSTVPFNAAVEALLMEGVSEILREASLRLPKQIGSAVGIVGTIVIGQAAVTAGLVSPLMVIIVSLSTLCSFVAPDFTIMNPIRILRFMMIILSSIAGLLGFIMGFTVVITSMLSLTSLGVPYLTPLVPYNSKDFKDFWLSSILQVKKRPEEFNTYDKTRK